MNTDLLRSFVEVAHQQSYSRAAQRLYLGQPTVYHHVKLLESILSVPLVVQRGKRTELTHQGRLLLDRATRILEELDSLRASVQDDASLSQGNLEIGGATTFGEFLMPWLMAAFHHRYPGVRLSGAIVNDLDILDRMVLDRRLDAAISPGGRPIEGLMKQVIMSDALVLAVPSEHHLADLPVATPTDLTGVPLVTFPHRSVFRQAVDAWFTETGASPSVAMELGSQQAQQTAVLAGAGIAILSHCTVATEVAAGTLRAVPLSPRLERPWYLVLKSPLSPTHSVEAFLKLLHSDGWLPPWARSYYRTRADLVPAGLQSNGAEPA